MTDIVVTGMKGEVRQALQIVEELAPPQYALSAKDVVLDHYGNVYTHYGFKSFSGLSVSNISNVSTIYYSSTLDQFIILEGSTLKVCDPITGTVNSTYTNAFIAGSLLAFAEWTRTGSVYISDGTSYKQLTTSALTDKTTKAPRGAGFCLITFKGRVWSGRPNGLTFASSSICPSDADDPESFNDLNSMRPDDDGSNVNAFSIDDTLLLVHKDNNIFLVIGDNTENFILRNMNVGRGAIDKNAVYSYEKITYMICKDGIYRYNLMAPDSLIKLLGTDVGFRFVHPSSGCVVCPFISLFPPDFGKRYMMFMLQPNLGAKMELWKLDIDSLDFVRLCANNTFYPSLLTWSNTRVVTYIGVDNINAINFFGYVPTYSGENIIGEYICHAIDGGFRYTPKLWNFVNLLPKFTNNPTILMDVDGQNIYGYDLSSDGDTGQSGFNIPQQLSSYLMSLLFRKSGGLQPILSGFGINFDIFDVRKGRSFAGSNANNIDYIMTNATRPWISGKQVLIGGETSVIITHNLGYIPVSLCVSQEGWNINGELSVSNVNTSTFTVNIPAASPPSAGNKINYVILKRSPIIFRDAHISGGRVLLSPGITTVVRHGLPAAPTSVLFVSIGLSGNTTGVAISNVDSLTFSMLENSFGAAMDGFWIAMVEGTVDKWFRGNSTSVSPQAHGLGAVPSAAIMYPNQSPIVGAWGITSSDITNLNFTSNTGLFNYGVFA